jgi:hypothetical protein
VSRADSTLVVRAWNASFQVEPAAGASDNCSLDGIRSVTTVRDDPMESGRRSGQPRLVGRAILSR